MPSSTKDKKDVECYGVGDFPGSPVVKNPLSKARNMGSNTCQGTKIPQAAGQLSPYATLREAYNQEPTHCSEAWEQSQKKKERKERSFLCFGQDPLCNLQGPVQHKNMGPVQQEKHFNFEMIVQISFFKNLEAEIWDFKREEGNAHEDGQANIW